jgi:thiol-disulfide isomerase/thioredoxin
MGRVNSSIVVGALALAALLPRALQAASVGQTAPEFPRAKWLNTTPLTMKDLRGKVVLVDFWEYTCINCIRTLPYLKEWNRRYRPYGLVIVGVHTPEFASSGIPANVAAAVRRFGITYPVLLDSDRRTWNAYGNEYWPRDFLIDRNGVIRFDHIGEGGYRETELEIQQLLREGGKAPDLTPMSPVRDTDRPGAVCYLTTAETYIGSARGHLANRGGYQGDRSADQGVPGIAPFAANGAGRGEVPGFLAGSGEETTRWFEAPAVGRIEDGIPALDGPWTPHREYCQAAGASSRLIFRYHAAGLYLVADAGERGGHRDMTVELDGQPVPEALRGSDLAELGGKTVVRLGRTRLYRLVEGNVFGRHVVTLRPPRGARLYSFTFGTCVH